MQHRSDEMNYLRAKYKKTDTYIEDVDKIKLIVLKSKDDIYTHLTDFAALFTNLNKEPNALKEFSVKFSEKAFCYLLQVNNHDVGFVTFYANDTTTKTGYISLIGINSPYQAHGYGKLLINYCFDIMIKNGMEKVKLEVLKSNTNARSFYSHIGFNYLPDCSENSYYMQKNL